MHDDLAPLDAAIQACDQEAAAGVAACSSAGQQQAAGDGCAGQVQRSEPVTAEPCSPHAARTQQHRGSSRLARTTPASADAAAAGDGGMRSGSAASGVSSSSPQHAQEAHQTLHHKLSAPDR
jgi:hypothetical protein